MRVCEGGISEKAIYARLPLRVDFPEIVSQALSVLVESEMPIIVHQNIPPRTADEKKTRQLSFEQKLYWVFLRRTAEQHPKKWYDRPDDDAAAVFGKDRTTIVGWNKKLDQAGCITYNRKNRVNPVTRRNLTNRFFVAQPTPEVYAQVATATHGVPPNEPSEKSNTVVKVSHPDENTRDDSKSDKPGTGSTHYNDISAIHSVSSPLNTTTSNRLVPTTSSEQLGVENPTRLQASVTDWQATPASATNREEHKQLLQAKRAKLEKWKALNLPAPKLEREIAELEKLLAGGGRCPS
jgi:hypothetical protein